MTRPISEFFLFPPHVALDFLMVVEYEHLTPLIQSNALPHQLSSSSEGLPDCYAKARIPVGLQGILGRTHTRVRYRDEHNSSAQEQANGKETQFLVDP